MTEKGTALSPQVSTNLKSARRQQLRRFFALPLILTATAGVAVRATVRDSVPFLSAVFYATPWPLLAVCFLAVAGLLKPTASRTTFRLLLLSAGACALIFFYQHYEFPADRSVAIEADSSSDRDLKVVFWNVARGLRGWDPVFDKLKRLDADVYGLAEVDPLDHDMLQRLQREFPNYEVAPFQHGMVILSRFPIASRQNIETASNAFFASADVEVAGQQLRFIVADMHSWPLLFREAPMQTLCEIAMETADRPTVFMGDLNTPNDSVFCDRFRDEFVSPFEQQGRGFDCTWPVPLPVMAIDHLWVNKLWDVKSCNLGWTWVSDHRPIISELRLPVVAP
ncbi:endonuclease/exonuclease/phosphatase family protein [Fuerstiella marisgermanici]|uniref:Endonuclease/Exonuclease/phosphatase family protein n=1 Tax=Fuerstiella marisgermanici TaxID=1891926 RepID=A0A1P8WQH8_9PLAN|nr:endonuclease/exonuclease/phosphatase family protein [Fuerstiella marisgermanici]APZ96294.1 Endonuclease/Exonuclease/phosphatase family protein [Fuerstiella marisgermanici]